MKLKNAAKFAYILLLITCFNAPVFAEEAAKDKKDVDTAALFQKALNEYENKKQQEQDILAKRLNNAFTDTLNTWIDSAKSNRNSEIGTRLEQSWEKLSSTFKLPPTHIEYYLRGYKYTVVKSDVTETASITTVYKAVAVIQEDLYVERYHPSNISDIDPYFFTVTIDYTLNFEYKQDNFKLVSTDSKVVGFVNDVPIEIKKLRP